MSFNGLEGPLICFSEWLICFCGGSMDF